MSQQLATSEPNVSRPAWLSDRVLSVWCVVAAFGTYFCMYGFRKPFTAAEYADILRGDWSYKVLLVTAQTMGYTLSKFLGIKVIAELSPQRRVVGILVLISIAQFSLLMFALVPPPINVACLFLNGLPLGMVFGMVLSFLEGRRMTEAFAAGLCASFILADGVTKSVGGFLLTAGVAESWMPAIAGLIFVTPLLAFVAMLARIPPPSDSDVRHRGKRQPMDRSERWKFFLRYAPGLTLLVFAYLLITILRSIRADFAPEIWSAMGWVGQPAVYTMSEIAVMLGVVLVNGMAVLVNDNRRAFFGAMAISVGGLMLVGVAVLGLIANLWGGFAFMVLVGLGLYLPYVAVHTTVFERLIAMTGDRGNIGYLMYLADAFGYLGYAGVMFARQFLATPGASTGDGSVFLAFFRSVSLTVSAVGATLMILCWIYFARRAAAAS